MNEFATALSLPDLWQQEAVHLLRAGRDVIVHAPTGAGKTLIFERFVEETFAGKAVFTVPTRALANDKLREWREKGWNVGIETGDLSLDRDAPVVVATLETQKRALLHGRGPDILVIDEYQMLADPTRGVSYELALAMAPAGTQLLLLSGSVADPSEVGRWLRNCGRDVAWIDHPERPVPLDEIRLDALPNQIPRDIRGHWPRHVARALAADLGPILIFSPRRKAAEDLARKLAGSLPEKNPLSLTEAQRKVAGPELARVLKNRVAFHHSGMSYTERAGLVEALAKANQLKILVATTGLAAGINFSLRSVLVLDREYQVADGRRLLRPDELLQMFGRAGRRGMDQRGSVLYLAGMPRLAEAKPLSLKQGGAVDWPSLLTVIQAAVEADKSPLAAARRLTARLFSREPVRLGLEDFLHQRKAAAPPPNSENGTPAEQKLEGGTVIEFQNSEGLWERRRPPVRFKLKDTWLYENDGWHPGLSRPKLVASLRIGTVCRFGKGRDRRYGLDAPLAVFPASEGENRLRLTKWLRKALRDRQVAEGKQPNVPRFWSLAKIESEIVPLLPSLTRGGRGTELSEHNNTLFVRLDYSEAEIDAFRDRNGLGLLNPPKRRRRIAGTGEQEKAQNGQGRGKPRSIAELWFALGLIDERAHPTRRGIIFSFFNHGEGLAVAAALEEPNYPVEEIVYDLANLRAGHRFEGLASAGRPLASICRNTYHSRTIPGYLRRGLPEDYGDGASEILFQIETKARRMEEFTGPDLSRGDIERARTEWRSLRAHVATAPDHDWDRWLELKALCARSLAPGKKKAPFEDLPPLSRQQKGGIRQGVRTRDAG